MKIGLLGFGTIGSGVYEIISNNKNKYLNDVEVKTVLVKDEEEKTRDFMVLDFNEILNDKEITTVVEVIGGINPAYKFISESLKAGKNVVTANKAVVAAHLKEFQQLAKDNNVKFLIEASTGGGIPWIKSIQKARRVDEIESIEGIFNGTTNFILDNMTKNGVDFNEILATAQQLGYAEANPSADIDGYDIQNKTMISNSFAFNTIIDMEKINVFGIRNIIKKDIDFFKNNNKVVKLLSSSINKDNKVALSVEPVLFDSGCIEANVSSNFNIGSLVGTTIGELKFYGQGAGKLPTANAIVQDIVDIVSNIADDYDVDFTNEVVYDDSLLKGKYLIRLNNETSLIKNVDKVEQFENSYYYTTNEMSSKEMHDLSKELLAIEADMFFARIN